MPGRGRKLDLLKRTGFRYHFDREVYYNRQLRKVFSLEWIKDNDEALLDRRIRERPGGWQFYFNVPPKEAVQESIKREISR